MNDKLNVCQTCLSSERRLYPLRKLRKLLQYINISEIKESEGGVCWECKMLIIKFYRFKIQVREVQETLSEVQKPEDLKCLSRLTYQTKYFYDSQWEYNDPLTHTIIMDNEEPIKEEPDIYSDHDTDDKQDLDEKPDAIDPGINIYVDTIDRERNMKSKRERRLVQRKATMKSKHKETDTDKSEDEEVRDKFFTVVLTEEEMLRCREEKRNQPNFKKIPYKCDTCVLGFTRKETHDLHMEKKHHENIGANTCDICQVRFSNVACLERHRRRHVVLHRCRLCKYETPQLRAALAHCRSKHDGDSRGRIHCSQCTEVLETPEDLAEHIRTQHTLYCNECGEKFKGKNTLRTHKRRIHGVKRDFVCDICTKTFKTKSRLESHMVQHNSTLAKKLAYCNICNVQYKNIYVYRNHLKNSVNHSEQAYQCSVCNKKFASKVYWKKHYNFYHLQKSQFKCEVCNKLFISEWRLKNHRQLHHGLSRPRNHPCNVCGKKFFTLSTLKGHQLTHSEQRTYMCEDCGDTFKQRPALYTHARLVHRAGERKTKR